MDERKHQARILSLLVILILVTWSGGAIRSIRTQIDSQNAANPPVIAKVYYASSHDLQTLCRDLEVRELNETENYIEVRISQSEINKLTQCGHRVEILLKPTITPGAP